MAVEWSPNDWSNILTVGAAALCSLLMVLFKSRCSKISLCWGIFSCNRVVKDDDDEPDAGTEHKEPKPATNEVASASQPAEAILPARAERSNPPPQVPQVPPPQVPEIQVNP
tara:strand:- start:1568 stop:1903 length:336 start_codon:yes stop_codon:yes gene_type:complete